MSGLIRRPIFQTPAKRFLAEHHRHNYVAPAGWLFGSSLLRVASGEVVAVGWAGRPSGRGLDDGQSMEVARVCTLGDRNACSMLYGGLCRAGEGLGYVRAFTYTLEEEDGASVKAAGFVLDKFIPAREAWERSDQGRYQTDLFGNERRPPGAKWRWRRDL